MRKLLAIAALSPLLFAGSAFAQTSTTTATSTSATTTATTTTTTTTTTSTAATSGPALAAQAEFVTKVFPGNSNAVLSILTLDATRSGQPVTVQSVPFSVSASNGATLSTLSSCALYSTAGVQLSTGANAVSAVTGTNTLRLDTPIIIPAGQGALLVVRCSVAVNAPVGGILTLGFSPASFQATSASGTLAVTQGFQSAGQLGNNTQSIIISAPGTPAGTPTTPGIPNTGAGGDALLYLSILALSAMAAFLGFRGVVKN